MQEVSHDKCESVRLMINNLSQVLMIGLGILTLRKPVDFVIIAVLVAVSYYSTCVVNPESTFVWLNGLRRYWQFMFVIPIIRYLWRDPSRRARFVRLFDRTLYLFLLLQAPCLMLQAVVWGMGDKGGGSLGWFNSGTISNIIYLISFYLMVRRWNPHRGYFGNLGDNWILLALLFPSFLNETKVSFIYLVMYFLFLLPFDRYFLRRLFVVVPMTAIIFGGAFWWYVSKVDVKGDVFKEDFFEDYVFGANMIDFVFDLLESDVDTDEVWESDYARGIKYALIPTLLERGENNNEIWGYGVGQFKGGNFTEKTEFAKHYEWILRGTQTEVFDSCVELGYTGLTLLVVYFIVIFRIFRRVGRRNRNRRFTLWMSLNILISVLYTVGFDSIPFCFISLYMIFISSRWTQLPAYENYSLFFSKVPPLKKLKRTAVKTISILPASKP